MNGTLIKNEKKEKNSKKRALLIGINYISIPEIKLNGCIDDIIIAKNMLIDAYDYDSSDITVLRDDLDNHSTCPNHQNIICELQNIIGLSSSLDEIWIQYSGHGSQISVQNNNHINDLDDVIVPLDYQTVGFISEDMLYDILKAVDPQCKTVLIFDCCHSGNICKFPWTINAANLGGVYSENNETNGQISPNIFALSGCKDSQTSADEFSRDLNQGVGAFSNALNECLRESHHQIDVLTLYKQVCQRMVDCGYEQTPVLTSGKQVPDYVFSRTCSQDISNCKIVPCVP
jgi:hypothetical protein